MRGQIERPPPPPDFPQGEPRQPTPVPFSVRAKWATALVVGLLAGLFLLRVAVIVYPLLWALVAAYLLNPVVTYGNRCLAIPRFGMVVIVYVVFFALLIDVSRYLVPVLTAQVGFFVEDSTALEGRLIHLVGPSPLGINIDQLVTQLVARWNGVTGNPKNAEKVLATALSTTGRIFLFLVSTFYLLMDAPRIRRAVERMVPLPYRPEIQALAQRIHRTWMGYIRGELVLFVIMATASGIGLQLLRVPGAVPLAIATGALELLPLIGPFTAGALAVSLAYFNGTNPFGLSQATYALIVAGMYFVLREAEDYFVIPKVLGRAVQLHPLVVLFALASGGLVGGLFGLVVAVPVAASVKILGAYLYDKLVAGPPQFMNIHMGSIDDR